MVLLLIVHIFLTMLVLSRLRGDEVPTCIFNLWIIDIELLHGLLLIARFLKQVAHKLGGWDELLGVGVEKACRFRFLGVAIVLL